MKKMGYCYKVAEMSIKYESKVPASERMEVKSSDEMASTFLEIYDKDTIEMTETAYAMIMNKRLKVMGVICVGMGTSCNTIVDIRKVMQAALLCNGTCVAICHNHPSYDVRPSKDDDLMTNKMNVACNSLGMQFIDHIILAPDGTYYSYADEGKI